MLCSKRTTTNANTNISPSFPLGSSHYLSNPSGLAVLQSYRSGSRKSQGPLALQYSSSLKWVGLRPSQLTHPLFASEFAGLPAASYQAMTDRDRKTCERLAKKDFCGNDEVVAEIDEWMKEGGTKVELEALNWIGMDFLGDVWLKKCVENGDFI